MWDRMKWVVFQKFWYLQHEGEPALMLRCERPHSAVTLPICRTHCHRLQHEGRAHQARFIHQVEPLPLCISSCAFLAQHVADMIAELFSGVGEVSDGQLPAKGVTTAAAAVADIKSHHHDQEAAWQLTLMEDEEGMPVRLCAEQRLCCTTSSSH